MNGGRPISWIGRSPAAASIRSAASASGRPATVGGHRGWPDRDVPDDEDAEADDDASQREPEDVRRRRSRQVIPARRPSATVVPQPRRLATASAWAASVAGSGGAARSRSWSACQTAATTMPSGDEHDRIEERVVVVDRQRGHRRQTRDAQGQDDPAEREGGEQPAGRGPFATRAGAGPPGQPHDDRDPDHHPDHETVREQSRQRPGEDPQTHEQEPDRQRDRHAGPAGRDERERGPRLGEVVAELGHQQRHVAEDDDRHAAEARPGQPATLGAGRGHPPGRAPRTRRSGAAGRSPGRDIAS